MSVLFMMMITMIMTNNDDDDDDKFLFYSGVVSSQFGGSFAIPVTAQTYVTNVQSSKS